MACGKLNTKENLNVLALKVVRVTYERWWRTRGAKCSDLTWKLLVFWKTGCLGKVVADGGSTVLSLFQILWWLDATSNFFSSSNLLNF